MLYTQSDGSYVPVRNLSRASSLPAPELSQFFHSKTLYKKFILGTRKVNRWKRFARFKNEIWCIDLAFVVKLANENHGVKYLLVPRDLFDRIVDAKRTETKISRGTVRTFSTMNTKENNPETNWVDKRTEFAGELQKVCDAQGLQIYPTMSESKAAFAARTIRFLKLFFRVTWKFFFGYKYIHR